MAKLQISYKGAVVSEQALPFSVGDTFTMKTSGEYCESDITAEVVSASILPSDYQEVEYLQGTGYQYIDLGVEPTATCTFTVDFDAYGNSSECVVFGANTSWSFDTYLCFWTGNYLYWVISNPIRSVERTRHTYKVENLAYYVDDVRLVDSSIGANATHNTTIKILNSGAQYIGVGFLYGASYSDFQLEKILVPCYRISDLKPGMYDYVNDVFYTNQGTGEFIVGPNVN